MYANQVQYQEKERAMLGASSAGSAIGNQVGQSSEISNEIARLFSAVDMASTVARSFVDRARPVMRGESPEVARTSAATPAEQSPSTDFGMTLRDITYRLESLVSHLQDAHTRMAL